MNQLLVSIPTFFLFGFGVGFFIGKKTGTTKIQMSNKMAKRVEKQLKVLHKSEPTTYEEKVAKALDDNKKVIKTFYK